MPFPQTKRNIEPLASAAVLLSAAFWGLFWVPIRHFEANGIQGAWAVVALYLPACVILLPPCAWDWRRQGAHLRLALLVGALVGLGLSCYGVALIHTSVARATLLFYLTPAWSTLLAFFLLREPLRWNRWAAILLGLLGMLLLVSGDGDGGGGINAGDLLALLSGMFWALGATLIRANAGAPILGMTLSQFLFTLVFVPVIAGLLAPLQPPDAAAALPLLATVALASVLMLVPSIFLLLWASQLLSPGRVGLLMMSEIIVALLSAGYFLPEETLGALQWLGAGLILAAAAVEFSPRA